MGHAVMGRLHAAAERAVRSALARQRGQGTVEYVALILLVAVVLAGVVSATKSLQSGSDIAVAIVKKLKSAIDLVK